MFASLKLFASQACPDTACQRGHCFFSHIEKTPSSKSAQSSTPHANEQATKRHRTTESTSQRQKGCVLISGSNARGPQSVSKPDALVPSARPGPSVTRSTTVTSTVDAAGDTGPPPLPKLKFSPQPLADRQQAINTLYEQFKKLYGDILLQQPTLAQESALEQEAETSGTTRNLKAYKLAIHQAAVSVSRRPRPDRIPHPSIGTVKQHRLAAEAAKKAEASKLTVQRISSYCLDASSFTDWGYPDPNNPSLLGHEQELSVTQICDRCKTEFSLAATYELGHCVYHFGKLRPEQQFGRRTWLYTCCGKERGSQGCEESVHVFSLKEDDMKLAAQEPFKTTQQVVQSMVGVNRKPLDIVALDCEMIYTTGGSALARVTVVDEDGNQVLDEFVRQRHSVMDYNTRFSGVTPSNIETAAMDLDAVRTSVCHFVGPDTIVVGHGLENDLRALRLLHPRVVDTAIGRPYRLALRDLVKEKLGYFIQAQSDTGHSSLEDARATIEILRWKVRESP